MARQLDPSVSGHRFTSAPANDHAQPPPPWLNFIAGTKLRRRSAAAICSALLVCYVPKSLGRPHPLPQRLVKDLGDGRLRRAPQQAKPRCRQPHSEHRRPPHAPAEWPQLLREPLPFRLVVAAERLGL